MSASVSGRLLRGRLAEVLEVPRGVEAAFRLDLVGVTARAAIATLVSAVGAQLCLALGGTSDQAAWIHASPHIGLLLSLSYVAGARGRSPMFLVCAPELVSRALLLVLALGAASFGAGNAPLGLAIVLVAANAVTALGAPVLSAIYGAIYPPQDRGRLISYGRVVSGVVAIATASLAGRVLAADPSAYRYLYPLAAVGGLLATAAFSRLDLRRVPPEEAPGVRGALAILRSDRLFLRFQAFQFLLGIANLMAGPVVAVYVSERLKLPIDQGVLVVTNGVVMQASILLTVRLHGTLFDKLGVVWHRVVTCVLLGLGTAGFAFADGLGTAAICSALIGTGVAGGQIIWILGALAFAPKERRAAYSAIHMFLAGVRGVTAPLVGVWLVEEGPLRGRFDTLFLIAGALMGLAAIGNALFVHAPKDGRDAA